MNARKIRAGLYQDQYKIDEYHQVSYLIERNTQGNWDIPLSHWIIRSIVSRMGKILMDDLDTESYPRLRDATRATSEMAGNWSYHPGLGWCYDGC